MKAVIIGASREALHTIEKAHEAGLSVTALDGNPEAEGLKAADRGLVVDISDENAVIEAVRAEKPDFVLTVPIGRYLTASGAVNDALGLPGIGRQMAVLCTDKYRFHRKLQEQKLRDSHCYAVGGRDGMEPEELGKELADGRFRLAYPAILKPRFGSGSRGIQMIEDQAELDRALQSMKRTPKAVAVPTRCAERTRAMQSCMPDAMSVYAQQTVRSQETDSQRADCEACVLEECVPGEEYGVDGAVIQGRFYLVLLRKKENTPPPARQAVGYVSVLPGDAFRQQAENYMERVVRCLGLGECLLHADLIRSDSGPFIIELSARPSGHNLHNLFTPLCTGIDMAEEYIKYRMGQSWNFTPETTRQAMIHYFDLQGRVMSVPGEEQVRQAVPSLIGWECHIKAGEELASVSDGHSLMGRGYFILEGEEQELREDVNRVKELFRIVAE